MLSGIFDRIIELSISGSIVALLIIAIKVIFKEKFSLKWHYLIWLVLIVKLLMPIDIESSCGIIPKIERLNQIETVIPMIIDTSNDYSKWTPGSPVTNEGIKSGIKNSTKMLKIIWGIIIVAQIVFKLRMEWLFYIEQSQLKRLSNPMIDNMIDTLRIQVGIQRNVGIWIDKGSSTPKVYGLINPKIIISEEVLYTSDVSRIRHILLHELCHIKQKDILINIVRNTLMCLYFFNPIIIWSLKRMAIECESACDERVLKLLSSQEHKAYGYTLISLMSKVKDKQNTLTLSLCRKKDVIRRLKMIKTYRKISFATKLMGLVITGVIIGSCLLTPFSSAQQQEALEFIRPLEEGTITSYYGSRFDDSYMHDGVDISAEIETEILAAEAGKVVYIDLGESEYGKFLVIEHSNGIKTLYAQCNEILVETMSEVKKGDVIATVGSTGKSTGPHLHFGVLKDDVAIDPKPMMNWIE